MFRWFWRRINHEWILTRQAAILFGIASLITIFGTAFLFGSIDTANPGTAAKIFWGIFGVLIPLSMFFLWGGMIEFLQMQEQLKGKKSWSIRLIFFVGICYTALVYYLVVYLPTRTKMQKAEESVGAAPDIVNLSDLPGTSSAHGSSSGENSSNVLKLLRYVLYIGWSLFALFLVGLFVSRYVDKLVSPVAPYFVLLPIALLLLTWLYKALCFVSGKPRSSLI